VQDVDDAVHRVGSVQGAAGAADHFDRVGLFRVDLEHLVDVAEAGRPDRNAVLEEQECAA
jgi:hypothetical protein